MKKLFVGLLILVVIAVAMFWLLPRPKVQQEQIVQQPEPTETEADLEVVDFPEPPAGSIVFNMKYRGLSGGKDELRYNSFWGFGSSGESGSTFIEALRKNIKNLQPVRNRYFKGAEWSAVELKDNEVVAFYFDLNADGKVSDNEKILPIQTEAQRTYRHTEFVTPDFIVNTRNGRQVPFRALLRVAFYGSSSPPQCMWSPSCILEGTSTIDGEPTNLILLTNGFSGSFKDFGMSRFSLQTGEEKTGRYVPQQTLSSLINHDGQFYHLKLYGDHEKGKAIRAVLEKDTTPTGEMSVKLTGDTNLKARLSSARITGSKDTTIHFDISGGQSKLPAGAYKLNSGYINYGTKNVEQWQVNFTEGPEMTIDPENTCNVELGKPVLSVSAIDEKNRYRSNAKEQSVFSKGTRIYLSPKIKGKAGEVYGRFSQRGPNSRRQTDKEPKIRIVDADGKEVASAKMEYG